MRKLLWATFGVALISMVFAGCKKDEPKEDEPTYMVQVTATDGGTVEGQSGEYKEGETVVFTAVPAEGYYFTKWSDGKTDNPRKIIMFNSDVNIEAQFEELFTATGAFGNQNYVDLGLESGTLWITCNLGATAPWEYGGYYAWGETQTKDFYGWETYKYCKGSYETLTKYCSATEYGFNGFTDTLGMLLPEDDAATSVLGSDFSMPTDADWGELGKQCYWVWTDNYIGKNVAGRIVYKAKVASDKGKIWRMGESEGAEPVSASYSLSDTHIFLPAAGYIGGLEYQGGSDLYNAGCEGVYWSSYFMGGNAPYGARLCSFDCNNYLSPNGNGIRSYGFSVRPVCRK
ncbi:MAG: hypothetical protein IJ911_13615 [Salinivirgaceae bacterium]|nr:hypothetical protein [Salinivirgaceae bacterium]